MCRFLLNDLATAWRTARVRILIEILVIAITLPYGLLLHVPQIYFGHSARAARLAQIAAARSRSAESEEEREFYRRETAWYRAQSRGIFWRAIRYALYPGYGPGRRDEQRDAELTIRDLETRELLELHGFGWSRYQWLAENHSQRAEDLRERLGHIEEGKWDVSCFELKSLKRELDWHSRMEQYYLSAAGHPWRPLQDDLPNP
jgi:hypothetical protein